MGEDYLKGQKWCKAAVSLIPSGTVCMVTHKSRNLSATSNKQAAQQAGGCPFSVDLSFFQEPHLVCLSAQQALLLGEEGAL